MKLIKVHTIKTLAKKIARHKSEQADCSSKYQKSFVQDPHGSANASSNQQTASSKSNPFFRESAAAEQIGQSMGQKFKGYYESLKSFSQFLKKGTKELVGDVKFLRNYSKNPSSDLVTAANTYFRKQCIKSDLIKFSGFSFFVFVPGSTLVLPFYLTFMPKSIPTRFQTPLYKMLLKRFKEDRKNKALQTLYNTLAETGRLAELINKDKASNQLSLPNAPLVQLASIEELITNWDSTYKFRLAFHELTVLEKEALLDFLHINYISGLHIINTLLNIAPYVRYMRAFSKKQDVSHISFTQYTLNTEVINKFRAALIQKQYRKNVQRLQEEDRIVSEKLNNQISKLESEHRSKYLLNRGIDGKDEKATVMFDLYNAVPSKDMDMKLWMMVISNIVLNNK